MDSSTSVRFLRSRANLKTVPTTSGQDSTSSLSKPKFYATRSRSVGPKQTQISKDARFKVQSRGPIKSTSTKLTSSLNFTSPIFPKSRSSSSIRTTLEKTFKCDQERCDLSFGSKHNLNMHISNVHSDKTFKCDRENCEKSFGNKISQIQHIRDVHSDQTFKCDRERCDKSFRSKRYLDRHISDVHSDQSFKCGRKRCDKSFRNKRYRDQHINKVHSDNKRFKCDQEECDKSFVFKSHLIQHLKSHTKMQSHRCTWNGCSKTFTRKNLFARHLTSHSKRAKQSSSISTFSNNQLPESPLLSPSSSKRNVFQAFDEVDHESDSNEQALSIFEQDNAITEPIKHNPIVKTTNPALNMSNCMKHSLDESKGKQKKWRKLIRKILTIRPKNRCFNVADRSNRRQNVNPQDRTIFQLSNSQSLKRSSKSVQLCRLISDEQSLDETNSNEKSSIHKLNQHEQSLDERNTAEQLLDNSICKGQILEQADEEWLYKSIFDEKSLEHQQLEDMLTQAEQTDSASTQVSR